MTRQNTTPTPAPVPAARPAPANPPPAGAPNDKEWADLTCGFEVSFLDDRRDEWGPWLPYRELLPNSGYARPSEIEYHCGEPVQVAEEALDLHLASLVQELHELLPVAGELFRIRAQVDQHDGTPLVTLEASAERIAAPLFQATCTTLRRVQHRARKLAGDAQRAKMSTTKITEALHGNLTETEVHCLLEAHRTADQVNTVLEGFSPQRSELHVYAHPDGLARITLGMDRAILEQVMESENDPDWHDFDYQEQQHLDCRDADRLLTLLKADFIVTNGEGRPARPEDLVPAGLSYRPAVVRAKADAEPFRLPSTQTKD